MNKVSATQWWGFLLILPALISLFFAETITEGSFLNQSFEAFQQPSGLYWMGTDDLGRDLWTGVVQGLHNSLIIGLGVTILAYSIGLTLGMISGFFGGILDLLLLKLSEVFVILPRFLIVILSASLLGQGVLILILTLGLFSWTTIYRIVRSEVLSLRRREYVLAAVALGSSPEWIGRKHLFPAVLPLVLSIAPLSICHAILTEAGISFLGLGDSENVSIGYLISNANNFIFSSWWMFFFPGASLTLTVMGFSLISYQK